MICDTLRRHVNAIYPDAPEEKIHQKSIHYGDLWLSRNSKYIENFTIPYNVMRWDEWLTHDKYLDNRNKTEELYNNNLEFKKKFDNSA